MDRFDAAGGVFLTFEHSVNLAIQKCFNIPSDHDVTKGTLVKDNTCDAEVADREDVAGLIGAFIAADFSSFQGYIFCKILW